MDDGTLFTIGELARRTGLSVRTIRFYSDAGLVPPTTRSPAGYRRYDLAALSRLDLVRTLRELGVDLATIRRLLDREVSVSDVAAAHARALDAQIRILRLRRAVLLSVARRPSRRWNSCTGWPGSPSRNATGSSTTSSTRRSTGWTPTRSSWR